MSELKNVIESKVNRPYVWSNWSDRPKPLGRAKNRIDNVPAPDDDWCRGRRKGHKKRAKTRAERIEKFVMKEPYSGCWLWSGAWNSGGYGSVGDGENGVVPAHRMVYEHLVGPIPEGLELDHLCRTPCCVNPAHLEPVTRQVNVLRGNVRSSTSALAAAITHCPEGHPYSGGNVYHGHGPKGGRVCKRCRADCQQIINTRKRIKAGLPLTPARMLILQTHPDMRKDWINYQ